MAWQSYLFGNPVVFKKKKWYLKATGQKVTPKLKRTLRCPRCGMSPTEAGHDPCIADMEGVRNACCGHGVEYPYVQFSDPEIDKLIGEK
jgi:hypothetical protein